MSRIQFFPVPLFAMVMGTAGLSLAWRRADHVLGLGTTAPADFAFGLAAAVFIVLALAYAAKWVRFRSDAIAELDHPIRVAFFPAITVSLVLVVTAGASILPDAFVRAGWWVGAVAHLLAMLFVVRRWLIRPKIVVQHVTPAWFIALVGNIVVPLALGMGIDGFGTAEREMALMSFSIGMVLWLALLPTVMLRVLVHDQPLPAKLLPSLAILVAPPAVGMVSTLTLFPSTAENLAKVLYFAAVGFVLIVLLRLPDYLNTPFGIPAWAFSFPLAAFTVGTLIMAGAPGAPAIYEWLAWGLLTLTTGLIAMLYYLTLRAIARGGVFVPE